MYNYMNSSNKFNIYLYLVFVIFILIPVILSPSKVYTALSEVELFLFQILVFFGILLLFLFLFNNMARRKLRDSLNNYLQTFRILSVIILIISFYFISQFIYTSYWIISVYYFVLSIIILVSNFLTLNKNIEN